MVKQFEKKVLETQKSELEQMIAKDAANQGSASPLSKQMLTPGKKPEERSQELLLANFEKTDDELKHLIFTPEDH